MPSHLRGKKLIMARCEVLKFWCWKTKANFSWPAFYNCWFFITTDFLWHNIANIAYCWWDPLQKTDMVVPFMGGSTHKKISLSLSWVGLMKVRAPRPIQSICCDIRVCLCVCFMWETPLPDGLEISGQRAYCLYRVVGKKRKKPEFFSSYFFCIFQKNWVFGSLQTTLLCIVRD